MKKTEVMPIYALVFSLSMLHFMIGKANELTLYEAAQKGLIKLNIQALGGHEENCIQLKIHNSSSGELHLHLEPGTIFDNLDETQQDIIVVKSLKMKLHPNQKIDTVAYGFCCQSGNSSPHKGQNFVLGKKADSLMIKLCNYINSHKIEPWKAQNAVWTICNKHQLSSIGEAKDTSLAALFKICNEGRNEPLPWFHIVYSKVPGLVFSNIPSKVVLNFEYNKKTDKQLVINVYDHSGNKIKTLLANSYAGPGMQYYHFDFEVVNWLKGIYTLKLKEWEQPAFVKTFEL